jgi:hypothetical protein
MLARALITKNINEVEIFETRLSGMHEVVTDSR